MDVAGSVLDPDLGDHVCLPFDGERERMASTRAFTMNLRRGAKIVIITHIDSPEWTRGWLAPLVPGFREAEAAGQIAVVASADTRFSGGRLDAGRVLDGLSAACLRARDQGRRGLHALPTPWPACST
ncbi:MEDS domain-containing protein [Nonomuraea sp. NPDC048916]|uniref:MEDS domain-containing protein n=1 Tax=Nonomuraea sp. NPDC048916 TaxID=3154232 RepID=UPI0033CA7F25